MKGIYAAIHKSRLRLGDAVRTSGSRLPGPCGCAPRSRSGIETLAILPAGGLLQSPALELSERHRPASLFIRNATVLDMVNSEPAPRSLLVENGRITNVLPPDAAKPQEASMEVDAAGMFLLPGLVDSHVHTFISSAHYLLDLINGVTTVREMCGFPWLLALRDNVRTNKLLAPNIYLTGQILNQSKMDWYALVVRGPERARETVREQKQSGYDFIKVHNVLRPDVYDAILDEARKLDIDVVGHIPHEVSLSRAIERGQRTFEHFKGYYSDRMLELTSEDYVSLTREADVWNCPTLYTHRIGFRGDEIQRLLTLEEARYISKDDRAQWIAVEGDGAVERKIFEQSIKILQNLIAAGRGLKVIAGTDSGGGYPMMVPGFALHEELRLLHSAGLSNEACLRAATVNAALAMKKTAEFGTIQTGQRADFILVDGDPRMELANLSKIHGVCVRGVWLDRAALQEIHTRLRDLFADDQGLGPGQIPSVERMDALASAVAEMERRGMVQMDHNMRELKGLLGKHNRPTAKIDELLAARPK